MTSTQSGVRLSLIAIACAAALSPQSAIFAQQPPSGASAGGLEEIVVSARRREENVQDVPISIVALSAESLELRGVQQLSDHRSASAEHRADGRRRHRRDERQLPHARHSGHRHVRRWRVAVERRRPHDDERRRGRARRGVARPAGHVVRQEQHGRRDPVRDEAARRGVRREDRAHGRRVRPARRRRLRRRAAHRQPRSRSSRARSCIATASSRAARRAASSATSTTGCFAATFSGRRRTT